MITLSLATPLSHNAFIRTNAYKTGLLSAFKHKREINRETQEEAYLSKVKKTRCPQLIRPLLNTKVNILVPNDGLHHLQGIILVSEKTTVRILNDEA